jgi:hypothetical protein
MYVSTIEIIKPIKAVYDISADDQALTKNFILEKLRYLKVIYTPHLYCLYNVGTV